MLKKKHKKTILIGTIITFIQRIFLFSITYFIYRGFGFNSMSYFNLLLLQIFIQITIEGLPLPGGAGAQEIVTNSLYSTIFGNLTIGGMILTRTFSFYLPLIIIMLIIIIKTKGNYNSLQEE